MLVSVECFDGEPYEPLNLNKEQSGLVTGPIEVAPSRTGTTADKILKKGKAQAEQEKLDKVRLGNEELRNVLHFEYLGVLQSSDGDPLVPVNHQIA